jgi:hypothetical protein
VEVAEEVKQEVLNGNALKPADIAPAKA